MTKFSGLALSLAILLAPRCLADSYTDRLAEAERLHGEKSYSDAHKIYAELAAQSDVTPGQRHWIEFRLADTEWRAAAASTQSDPTRLNEPREALEKLIRDVTRAEDQDRTWAEIQESLGDWQWNRRDSRDWSGWTYYERALDWWAGAKDMELARDRYLAIVWKAARPAWAEPYAYYGYYGNQLPLQVIENTLKIARSDEDRAHAHYLAAMTLRQSGNWSAEPNRVPEEFEAAVMIGRKTDWYDDALMQYAQWMENQGRLVTDADGGQRWQPDFVKALALYRQLLKEFDQGETRYYDQARQRADEITRETVGVYVSNLFLPDSEIQFNVSWRNVKRLDIALYAVDLARDITLEQKDGSWLDSISLSGREKVCTIEKVTNDTGLHIPGNESITLPAKLEPGAYVVQVTGGGEKARELVLVTDAAVALKSSGEKALAWFCHAVNGAPIAGGQATLWERYYDGQRHVWRVQRAQTATNGLAVFDLLRENNRDQLFVAATLGNRQAYVQGYSYWGGRSDDTSWRIYAFTDRTAYRPGDSVQWKIFARTRSPSGAYATPADQSVEWEITDPQGAKAASGTSTLNRFGSAWGELPLTDKQPLGAYTIQFWDAGRSRHIGGATLFRLEEYKLPEFKVSISTPEESGRKKTFLLGENVEVEVKADYYFGGPVADAKVEFLVRQQPYHRWWHPGWDYPWYYRDFIPHPGWHSGGSIVKQEVVKTDAEGRARLTFETPQGAGQDFEYTIEARVTDSSRREIVGNGSVKVGRQRYFADVRPEHAIYGPQDKVTFNVTTLDPNDQPVQTTGTVKVTRQRWTEIWIRPDGREVSGPELRAARAAERCWPPFPRKPDELAWRQKFAGYESEEILSRTLGTDTNGAAQLSFSAAQEGYYVAAWTSPQEGGAPVTAQGQVWVSTERSTDIGYGRPGGIELIVDKDTFRVGEKAPVMIATPTSDRWVLFGVEGEDFYDWQVVHLEGTIKLIQLPVEERHVPNLFLTVAGFSDAQFFADTKQVVVPPEKNFLKIEVSADRKDYEPREEAELRIKATDHEGHPVAAELALAVADESVLYIPQDIAGDPRQFYFGDKRGHRIQTQSSMNQKQFVRLVQHRDQIMDERMVGLEESDTRGDQMGRYAVRSRNAVGYVRRAAVGGRSEALGEISDMAVAMPASAPMEMEVAAKSGELAEGKKDADRPQPQGEPPVVVRSDFRATAFWQPDVVTDANGEATVRAKMPDSLTTWRATARAATAGSQFGMGESSVVTRQPLIVRLQAPRFFVVGDTCTVSAVINNNTDEPMEVAAEMEANGPVTVASVPGGRDYSVPARGETRVDWTLAAQAAGDAKLTVRARGTHHADAMEKTYVVHEHGIDKYLAASTKLRGDSATLVITLPPERRKDSTTLTVQVAPSIAVTMLDALPYLANYPYGCTEQTLSRFLPAVVVAKTLRDMGLKPEAVADKLFGGIEEANRATRTNTLAKLDDMVQAGLNRLYDFQHGDGGWGWWKEGDSDPYMTAYVLWGFALAKQAGVDVRGGVVERGLDWLEKKLVEAEDQPDLQAWELHALSAHQRSSKFTHTAMERLWKNRDQLNAYTRALFLLASLNYGDPNKTAGILARNLRDGVVRDDRPDQSVLLNPQPSTTNQAPIPTAHWGTDRIWWRWSDGGIESTAFALKALLAAQPQDDLVEPAMNWLVKNRRGAQWSNTRDTAFVILSLVDYLKTSGETAPDLEYDVLVNGRKIATQKVTAENALSAPSRYEVPLADVRDGANEVTVVRRGQGALYAAAHAEFFSLEEPVTPAGHEIFVKRQYYKLEGRPTLLKGYVYEKVPLNDGDTVRSGDRIEVVAAVEAKNDYEYLVFEDLKPAGFEAVEVRSGQNLYARELTAPGAQRRFEAVLHDEEDADYTGRSRWVYQELRDRKVALFADKLPQGVWEIRYELRAETPGNFHALPLLGHAMYVPEIRANSAETRVRVVEAE